MAIYTVTSIGGPGAEGMTFEAAVAAANASGEADTIRFDPGLHVITLDDVVGITGELIIDGDHDNDGVSDVLMRAGDHARHLTVDRGADVIIRNVDFAGGFDSPKSYEGSERLPAARGTGGADGTLTPRSGMDGGNGNDDAGHGGDGSDGVDGIDAAGSILNLGTLRLERVGFGSNYGRGERGEDGGAGGAGGSSRAESGLSDYLTQITTVFGSDPMDFRNQFLPGGKGGDGGRGGNGGDGGDGGNGGSAGGAIFNEGHLTLVDTVFGGRLSSGVVVDGNDAYGGYPGRGGFGGYGGSSWAGDGGNSGRDYVGLERIVFDVPPEYHGESWYQGDPTFEMWLYNEISNEAGIGGSGGPGGDGGHGGAGGRGGLAASVVNEGQLTGIAAVIESEDFLTNAATGGVAGRTGGGGRGGSSYFGDGGIETGSVQTYRYNYDLGLLIGPPRNDRGHPWLKNLADSVLATYGDLAQRGSGTFPRTGQAASGEAGPAGDGGAEGEPGREGDASAAMVAETGATTAFTSSATLVYLHDMGQDPETGQLAFNIIRVGQTWTDIAINWAITGYGDHAVSAADFAGGTALSGTVEFAAETITAQKASGAYEDRFAAIDSAANVHRVVLDVAADTLEEAPEGYRIALTVGSGVMILGTDAATGTLIDTMIEASGPITGTPGPDTLDGTPGADEILGLGGDDLLRGMEGDDTLEGGDGADTINGGDGDDLIRGGDTEADRRDVIYAGSGDDSVDGGYGNDQIYGMDGNDTLAGGFGADTIEGQDGDDVITGSAFGDIVFGNAGNDFVNGGFGHDLINGGSGADKFFHAGGDADAMLGHGSDWVQDYDAAEGDVLVFGGSARADQFQVNFTHTENRETGERSGDDDVQEAFVIYRPTGQILWALVDGGGQDSINLQIGAEMFDLLG